MPPTFPKINDDTNTNSDCNHGKYPVCSSGTALLKLPVIETEKAFATVTQSAAMTICSNDRLKGSASEILFQE